MAALDMVWPVGECRNVEDYCRLLHTIAPDRIWWEWRATDLQRWPQHDLADPKPLPISACVPCYEFAWAFEGQRCLRGAPRFGAQIIRLA